MKAATAEAVERVPAGRKNLWLEFYRALSGRNFVRAVALAHALGLDERRIRSIHRDALRQFLGEYQNFDGATRLCAEYCVTADELAALAEDLLRRKELESKITFSLQAGKPSYLGVAAQIRSFVERQVASLRRRESSRKAAAWWNRALSAARSWFDWTSGFRREAARPGNNLS